MESSANRAYPHFSGRYGGMTDLIKLAVRKDEMRTLVRVLCSDGNRGKLALLQICKEMWTIAEAKASSELRAEGSSGSGETAVQGPGVEDGIYDRLSAEHLYQLLYRGYLSLGLTDSAGDSWHRDDVCLDGYSSCDLPCTAYFLDGMNERTFTTVNEICTDIPVISEAQKWD